ncbi:MAG: HD domain-containing protein [Nanobdellota archaeon]
MQKDLENILFGNLENIRQNVKNNYTDFSSVAESITPVFYKFNSELKSDELWHTLEFADYWHKNQFRHSSDPFVAHPIQVSFFTAFNQLPKEVVQGAMLHDVLEKNQNKWEYLSKEIYNEFGRSVFLYVSGMSKRDKYKTDDIYESTRAKKIKITEFNKEFGIDYLKIIKLADNIMNMSSVEFLPAKYNMSGNEFQRSQLTASKQHYYPLAREIDRKELTPLRLAPLLDKIYEKY